MAHVVTEQEYLEHFGVKGMRWGVKNEDLSTTREPTRRQQKATKFRKEAVDIQTKIDTTNTTTYSGQAEKRQLEQEKIKVEKTATALEQGKLTPRQKHVLIGASVTAAVLAAYGAKNMAQSGDMRRQMELGKAFITRKPKTFQTKEFLKQDFNEHEIMAFVVDPINRGYGAPGTKVNCRRCTFAYEMRRRGYDVAATKTSSGRGQTAGGLFNVLDTKPGDNLAPSGRFGVAGRMAKEIISNARSGEGNKSKLHKRVMDALGDTEIDMDEGVTGIFKAIKNNPDGARGELGVNWHGGGAHSMAWEMVKGKPVIFDTQTGKKYTEDAAMDLTSTIARAAITRLDDKPMNENFLLRWVKDA